MRIDVCELIELGYEHFKVLCGGVPVTKCYAVDTELGRAYVHRSENGEFRRGYVEGEITIVFPDREVVFQKGLTMIPGDE